MSEGYEMINDERLELDQVAGDFVDWFDERVHHIAVRHSRNHHDAIVIFSKLMLHHFEHDVEKFFGHELSFYTRS